MTNRLLRTQILLEPEQHQALAEIARAKKRSMSDLIRELIQKQLEQRSVTIEAKRQRQLADLDQIRQHRQAILDRRKSQPLAIEPSELIRQMRDKHDQEPTEGDSALADLFALDVTLVEPSLAHCRSALTWAVKVGQSRAYDGFDVSLAEELGVPLYKQIGLDWVLWIGA
jgi:predicted CopG family antitoxin